MESEDKRFKAAKSDPRFHRIPAKKLKANVDARFHRMFADRKNFECVDDLYAPPSAEPAEPPPTREEPNPYLDEEQRLEDSDESAERGERTSALLAVQNYDWQNLSADDLARLFGGLAREVDGAVLELTTHLSAFGRARLEEESRVGPQKALSAAFGAGEEPNMTALRKYELERLKYYFAIVRFDSAETATRVYDQFDGAELGFSGCKLDLRFVDASLALPIAEARAVPTGGGALPAFETRAMSHSNVQLTWEAPRAQCTKELFAAPLEAIDRAAVEELVDLDDEENLAPLAEAVREKLLGGATLFQDFVKKSPGELRVAFAPGFDECEEGAPRAERRRKSRKELLRCAREKAARRKAEKEKSEELALLVDEKPKRSEVGDDQRFVKRYSESLFAIDPTNSRVGIRNKIATEKKKRNKNAN